MQKKLRNSLFFLLSLFAMLSYFSCIPLTPVWPDYYMKYDTTITVFMNGYDHTMARSEQRISSHDKYHGYSLDKTYRAYRKIIFKKKDAIYRLYKRRGQADTLVAYYPLSSEKPVFRTYTYPGELAFFLDTKYGAPSVLPFDFSDSVATTEAFNGKGMQCEFLGTEQVQIYKKKYDCYKYREQPTEACRQGLKNYRNPKRHDPEKSRFQLYCFTEIWIDKKTLLPVQKKLWLDLLEPQKIAVPTPIFYGTYYFSGFPETNARTYRQYKRQSKDDK